MQVSVQDGSHPYILGAVGLPCVLQSFQAIGVRLYAAVVASSPGASAEVQGGASGTPPSFANVPGVRGDSPSDLRSCVCGVRRGLA